MYQSNVWSQKVIANYATFVSSPIIYFVSHILSKMSTCLFGSSDPSPQNSSNQMVRYYPTIVKFDEPPPLCGVET
jgi:hypothetical protein